MRGDKLDISTQEKIELEIKTLKNGVSFAVLIV